MRGDKIVIVGAGAGAGLISKLQSEMPDTVVLSAEEAKQQLTFPEKVLKITSNRIGIDLYRPPLTRRERRAKERKKKK